MAKIQLTVTNNLDDGSRGTLRWALQQTQLNRGNYEITFATAENARATGNTLNTGYWTIQLNRPLPTLYRSKIRVNYQAPKSVILLPSQNRRNFGSGASGSVLTVGDERRISEPLSLDLNQINFIRNTAIGQDGLNGGGGGLGAGGAVSLVFGDLRIRNSVFQDLVAVGGQGSTGRRGGDGAHQIVLAGDIITLRGTNGGAGGRGGRASLPQSPTTNDGTSSYDSLGPAGGAGGLTNNSSSSINGTTGGNGSMFPGDINSRQIGAGGGAGGSGGGGGTHQAFLARRRWGRGAAGGAGANGGFGAGGGAGGGGGANAQTQTGSNPGGPGGMGGTFASSGTNGRASSDVWGGNGGQGGNGAALGGAIAVLDQVFVSGRRQAHLDLQNVDFINATANAGPGARSVGALFGSEVSNIRNISGSSITTAVNHTQNSLPVALNTTLNDANIFAHIQNRVNEIDNATSFHEATSSVRVPSVARIRDITLTNTSGLADTNIINYEAPGSGVVGVTADLSDPNNALNQIWNAIVPDRADQIRADYNATITQNWLGAAAGAVGGALGTFGKGSLKFFNPVSAALAIGRNVAIGAWNHYQASVQFDLDIAENTRQQEELQEFLNSNTQSQVGTVDLNRERIRITIENFTLGEDVAILPDLGAGRDLRLTVGRSGRNNVRTVTISTGDNDGLAPDIVTIELSPQSNNELYQSNSSAADYLSDLLMRRPDGSWILGTRFQMPITQVVPIYTAGGPASTDVLLDRSFLRLGNTTLMSTTTLSGDDQIYATDGVERMETGPGEDLIFPELSPGGALIDRINAGPDIDTVAYTTIRQAISLAGQSLVNGRLLSQMDVSLLASGTQIAELLNVESIQAWGASRFEYQQLPDPLINGKGFYSIRTGSGSLVVGSRFNDAISLWYDNDTNDSKAAAYTRTSKIDGGTGTNSVYADFYEAPEGVQLQALTGDSYQILTASSFVLAELTSIQVLNLEGSALADTFNFSSGRFRYFVHGHDSDDLFIAGGKGSENHFDGDAGNDRFEGGDGQDDFNGGEGNDILIGRGGKDIFEGGLGDDRYSGGKGRDEFQIHADGSIDTITDFQPGRDRIELVDYNRSLKKLTWDNQTSKTGKVQTIVSDGAGLELHLLGIDGNSELGSRDLKSWISAEPSNPLV